jgi:hypothetical protein
MCEVFQRSKKLSFNKHLFFLCAHCVVSWLESGYLYCVYIQSPHLRTPNSGFNLGFTTFYITYAGGEPRVNPRVWCPEMWAQ